MRENERSETTPPVKEFGHASWSMVSFGISSGLSMNPCRAVRRPRKYWKNEVKTP